MIASSRRGGTPAQAARAQLDEGRALLGIGMAHHCIAEAQRHALTIPDRTEQLAVMNEITALAAEQLIAERELGHTIQTAAAPSQTVQTIDLALVGDNPFQTRQRYDDAALAELAGSIQEHGLLQLPLARRVGARYELAFGHRRLRAWRVLAAADPARFGSIPLQLRDLDDETMALHCWSENRQRRDITPYEEARAIERYTTAFGWTQQRAAERLGLDRSTVANKLRLLKLPPVALEQLQRGALSERQAAALLPLADLPAEVLLTNVNNVYIQNSCVRSVGELIEKAATYDSATLRKGVDQLREKLLTPLANAPWRAVDVFDPAVRAVCCQDCPIRIAASDSCPDRACYDRKDGLWTTMQAAAAAAAVELPVVAAGLAIWDVDRLDGVNLAALREVAATKDGCTLGVLWEAQQSYAPHPVADHLNCSIVCGHGAGKACGCRKTLATRTDTPEVSREAQQRVDRKRIREELIPQTEAALLAVLQQPTAQVWRSILTQIDHAGHCIKTGKEYAKDTQHLGNCANCTLSRFVGSGFLWQWA